MLWDLLAQKLEADFQNMEEVEAVEKDFDEIYPDDIFKDPLERQKKFKVRKICSHIGVFLTLMESSVE